MGIYGPFTYGTSAWQGVWTGINPVEWASVPGNAIARRARPYRWIRTGPCESGRGFRGSRTDNGAAIPWTVESPQHACLLIGPCSITRISSTPGSTWEQMLGNLAVALELQGQRAASGSR